jgi:hypothetical protein
MALGLLAATAAAPAAVAVLFGALYLLQIGWFAGQDQADVFDRTRLYAMMSAPVALFITLAFGSPIAHRLVHGGHRAWWRHALLGMALGATPFVLFDGYNIAVHYILDMRPRPDAETYLRMVRWAALGAWCGLSSASAYWLLAIRARVITPGADSAS